MDNRGPSKVRGTSATVLKLSIQRSLRFIKREYRPLRRTGGNYRKTSKLKRSEPKCSKTPRVPAGPRPFRKKAPATLKSLEANVSSKLESSSTAAEEKQNRIALRNAVNASASDSYLTTSPSHGNLVNGVAASDQSPTLQRPSASTPHQPSIGVTNKRPLASTSDLLFLPETKSKIKRQRIA